MIRPMLSGAELVDSSAHKVSRSGSRSGSSPSDAFGSFLAVADGALSDRSQADQSPRERPSTRGVHGERAAAPDKADAADTTVAAHRASADKVAAKKPSVERKLAGDKRTAVEQPPADTSTTRTPTADQTPARKVSEDAREDDTPTPVMSDGPAALVASTAPPVVASAPGVPTPAIADAKLDQSINGATTVAGSAASDLSVSAGSAPIDPSTADSGASIAASMPAGQIEPESGTATVGVLSPPTASVPQVPVGPSGSPLGGSPSTSPSAGVTETTSLDELLGTSLQPSGPDDPSSGPSNAAGTPVGTLPSNATPTTTPSSPTSPASTAPPLALPINRTGAPVPVTPSGPVIAPPDVDPNVARLGGAVRMIRRGEGGSVSIGLTPGDLGRVRVELRTRGDGSVSVHLTAERAVGAESLRTATSALRTELESDGLRLDQVSVSLGDAGQSGHSARDARTDDEMAPPRPMVGGTSPLSTASHRAAPRQRAVVPAGTDRLDLDL